jgi:hypothetical protein
MSLEELGINFKVYSLSANKFLLRLKTKNQTDRKYRLARIWSNRELERIARFFSGDIVNVSGAGDQDKEEKLYSEYFINKRSYFITNYAGDDGYEGRSNEILLDITAELPKELKHRFDVVFNHTMLEHVFDIFQAFRNLCDLSRDVVIVVVPFAQIQHPLDRSYGDYWRFTPSAIRKLFQANNLEVVYEAESPHRDAAVYLFFVGSRHPEKWRKVFPKYIPIKQAGTWIGNPQSFSQKSVLHTILTSFKQVYKKFSTICT